MDLEAALLFLSVCIFAVFALVGALHFVWALGIWWPIHDEVLLARSVVGVKGMIQMPGPAITFAVVGLVALGLIWIAFLANWLAPPLPDAVVTLGGSVMAVVLVIRGAGSYVAPLFGLSHTPEFTRLNRRWFSPVILVLGIGVALLTGAGS